VSLYEAIVDLSDTFIDLDDKCMELFSNFVFGEITGKLFDQEIRQLYFDRIRYDILLIKKEIRSKHKNICNAYYDVARYQTDYVDAAIEWNIDKRVLELIIEKRPPPITPEERHALKVPDEVRKKRELP